MNSRAIVAGAIVALSPSGWQAVAVAQETVQAPSGQGETRMLTPAAALAAAAATEAAQATEVIEGLELGIWAPPGLVANALTLDFDSAGRAYVVSSARAGLLMDIRQHPDWVPEVHSLKSTEQLREFFRREMAPDLSEQNLWLPDYNGDGSHDYRDLTVVAERVFRVDDSDGDGIADRSRVVHEGFNDDIASDIAGGVLIRDEHLYVTAAPDLWQLRDTTGNGLFDETTSLSHGYSVHPAFSGHDMSALAIGPDGRLYWKIGDIGLNVVDETGRRWAYPNTGAVLRAELDGSGFEVFAWGLRNTQEIAFDKYGNLVSVDNDGDHAGETERVVYIVQGSDAGWRSTWQYGKYTDPKNNGYNVWMDESLFRPRFEGQAAYITPPIAAHHSGPSGFVYNPGTALSERWRDYFFVTSFTGGASNASVYAFQLEPAGAGFTLANDTRIVGGLLSSGMAFAPDGALYLTDWINGWGATGQGQLWRLDVPEAAADPQRGEVSALLNSGFGDLGRRQLEALIAHDDMRVRLEAQFELVARGQSRSLRSLATEGGNQLGRIHAIWGLGQLARQNLTGARTIRGLLGDSDPEIRAQAAKTLGDVRDTAATDALITALTDDAPRVRFFATEALGRIGVPSAIGPIVAMLAANDDEEVYLRTAGVHALAGIGDARALTPLAEHPSPAVRIAAVVALRRLGDPGAGAFVDDPDPLVATEAARAINDEGGIVPALPALAGALDGPIRDEAFLRRAISANLRLGDADSAARIGSFAAAGNTPEAMRLEAIAALGVWPEPSALDRVDGAWLGQPGSRDDASARRAAGELLPLLDAASTSTSIKVAVLDTAAALGLEATPPFALRRLAQDPAAEVRIAALSALGIVGGDSTARAVAVALEDRDPSVRMAAIRQLPEMPLPDAVKVEELAALIDSAAVSTGEKQSALRTLGAMPTPEATAELGARLERLTAGGVPPELGLDLLEAVRAGNDPAMLDALERQGLEPTLANLATAMPTALAYGGSAQRGRQLALNHPAAQCTRCHALGDSESTVGPDLNGVGARLSREQLLESLLAPSASITPGFGDSVGSASAMPPMGTILQAAQIRDLVEFLANEN